MLDDEFLRAQQLYQFRKKQTELAWALLQIMNEVHKSHNLHNNISPDCQVRRLGGGVYVIQASWSMEDHGSVRRVSLGGR
jgi:hypothetical protein